MRTQPVYLLIDISGSMRGAAIEAARVGAQALAVALRRAAAAGRSVELCVMTFGHDAEVVRPLAPLPPDGRLPRIAAPEPGPTNLGLALGVLRERIAEDAREDGRERQAPVVCVMTDGAPSDVARFDAEAAALERTGLAAMICCTAGPRSRTGYLARLSSQVVSLDVTTLAFWDDLLDRMDLPAQAASEPIDWLVPPEHQVVI